MSTVIPFEVISEFKTGEVTWEVGNTHRKHNFTESEVNMYQQIGWVLRLDGGGPVTVEQPANVVAKPTDIINTSSI